MEKFKSIWQASWWITAVLICVQAGAAQDDLPGSSDHPLITRYPSSVIKWYDVQAFDEYKFATGPVSGYRQIDDWISIQGKLTRIFYSLRGNHTLSEVYANYRTALLQAGFEPIAEGVHNQNNRSPQIGGRSWLDVVYRENQLPQVGTITLQKALLP